MKHVISFCMFILGLIILTTKEFSNNRGFRINLDLNNHYIYLSLVFFIVSIYIFYVEKYTIDKRIYFSICHKCKETFDYKDLKDGKCPHCENIDTVDIEKYYKDKKEQEKETKIDKDKKDKINDETNTN